MVRVCAALIQESEHYEPGGDGTRGRRGPLNVAALRERAELADAFIEAAVVEGYLRNPDYNNGNREGFGHFQQRRRTAAAGRRRTPFWIRRGAASICASRPRRSPLLDGKRAVGAAYVQRGQAREARCSGEVILSAGAEKSPHLLELSGIVAENRPVLVLAAAATCEPGPQKKLRTV